MIGKMESKEFMDAIWGRDTKSHVLKAIRAEKKAAADADYAVRLNESLKGTWPPKRPPEEQARYEAKKANKARQMEWVRQQQSTWQREREWEESLATAITNGYFDDIAAEQSSDMSCAFDQTVGFQNPGDFAMMGVNTFNDMFNAADSGLDSSDFDLRIWGDDMFSSGYFGSGISGSGITGSELCGFDSIESDSFSSISSSDFSDPFKI